MCFKERLEMGSGGSGHRAELIAQQFRALLLLQRTQVSVLSTHMEACNPLYFQFQVILDPFWSQKVSITNVVHRYIFKQNIHKINKSLLNNLILNIRMQIDVNMIKLILCSETFVSYVCLFVNSFLFISFFLYFTY